MSQEFWETFYAGDERRWSGRPNGSLVVEVAGLDPGRALDLGCGEGGDAIWLARERWTVTGADISARALAIAERHAGEAGVGGTITWERHDLAVSLPAGPFDLVTSAFLHSPVELPRGPILRRAAELVAPGGTLLVVGHAPSATHHHVDLPTAQETVAELALPEDRWTLVTAELREQPEDRVDTVVRWARAGG
jgi:2-polyprenyl-3-methyl-5-hydroxy-6-metoxy-1,4-benzoquinol methylase